MIPSPSLSGRWFPLEDRAIFRLTGPDRVRYLNGQVTNDVSGALGEEAKAACLCTIKGRVEALVWISEEGESLLLDGERTRREAIEARLERYLIADDCEITDETDSLRLIHHFIEGGPGVKCRRLEEPGYDLFLKRGDPVPFPASLLVSPEELAVARLLAMIPEAGKEINAEEFPAELGLDRLAVSFHKGCYLGQEIISRLESVGKVKRHLLLIETPFPLLQGVQVENSLGESGLTTRSTLPLGEKSHLGLALFRKGSGVAKLAGNKVVTAIPKSEAPNS